MIGKCPLRGHTRGQIDLIFEEDWRGVSGMCM